MIKVDRNINKSLSWKYLLPILKEDKVLWRLLETNLIRRVGVYDMESPLPFYDRTLYIQIRNKGNEYHARSIKKYVVDVLKGFSYTPNPLEIVLIIKVRKEFKNSFHKFLAGDFSLMFKENEIEKLFSDEDQLNDRGVLQLDKEGVAGDNFKEILSYRYYDEGELQDMDIQLKELDFQPSPQIEIFNFKGEENNFKNIKHAKF